MVYTSDVEKELFENYILDNWDKVNQSINENNTHVFGTEHLSQFAKEDITKKVKSVKVLKDEFENFRKIIGY
ncbi:hypothetical protein MUA33_00215 [Staphylococcus delphini]|uniref:hypothetical protein n=1 Tax=Staphylococcus delphini TaxID=53344 RepID=UPI0021D11871|nr:hypothetical protein [Staphylococcus delphini]UXS29307.1 hypothetical protein MUA33_00215 [Staphylococcus delphini]